MTGDRFLRWLAALLLALPLALSAAVPPATSLLVDGAGALQEADRQALLQRLQRIQAGGRTQVAILLAPGTDGLPLADYALQVAQAWKLGHAGKDDGLLVVVVPSQAAARIEVGYGLEGAIPDVKAAEWIDDLLLRGLREDRLALALDAVLDRIEAALPAAQERPRAENILDQHPEWKLPFVFAIFSPFALFPMFIGRWGSFVSAPLFAVFMGFAAWSLWGTPPPTAAVATVAFALPLLWGLNGRRENALPGWLRVLRHIGNLAAVLIMFSLLTVFIGVALWGHEEVWGAPMFGAVMALGLAVFLFPGKPARVLMVVLRSVMHFGFFLVLAYVAVDAFVAHPARVAPMIAAGFTAVIALSLWLDHLESRRIAAGEQPRRWSLWLVGLVLLGMVPFALLLVVQAWLGENPDAQLAQAAAGGGSLAGVLWWAARKGFFAALAIGLGGRFGGGGAEGRN